MAKVRSLTKNSSSSKSHPTEVDAEWSLIRTDDGELLLQLSTFGSDLRASTKKVSQTLQFDRSMAKGFKIVLEGAFPGI